MLSHPRARFWHSVLPCEVQALSCRAREDGEIRHRRFDQHFVQASPQLLPHPFRPEIHHQYSDLAVAG